MEEHTNQAMDIEQTNEDPVYRENVKIKWSEIAKKGPEYFIEETKIWEHAVYLYELHKDCKKTIDCPVCTRKFCECLDFMTHFLYFQFSKSLNCFWCDEIYNPCAANPLNEKHMKKYCPDKLQYVKRAKQDETNLANSLEDLSL